MMIYNSKFENQVNKLIKFAYNSCLSNKHSACILNKNKIYSIGYNKYISQKNQKHLYKKIKFSIHAEIDALFKLHSKTLNGLDILIIRVNKSNRLINSRPCNNCIEQLLKKKIRKVYYSNDNGEIVCELVQNMKKIHTSSGYLYRLQ